MKTAISVPDDLFARADELARRTGVSRSEIYVRALREYVIARDSEHVLRALNLVDSTQGSSIDEDLMQAQVEILSEWEE